MTALFLKVLNMSIAASWLVLVVLVLRLLLKRAPKWVNVLLWGLVAVRLLCPFSVESAISLIPSAETIPERVLSGPSFEVQTGVPPVDDRINEFLGERYFEGVTVPAHHGPDVMTALTYVWLAGILLLAAYAVVSFLRLRYRTRTAVRYRGNCFQSENVSAPFVLGIVRPRVYLPFGMNAQELEYVLAHEQAHILRKDHWWKPLGFFLLTLHWFNPAIWLAYALLCRDVELACDEKVIRELDNEQRADYSQTLVACSRERRRIAACPLAFGEVGVKARVKSVLHYRKPAFWLVLLAVVVCAATAVCFLTNPASHASLQWAKTLSADDVSSAERVAFPQNTYKQLSDEELARLTALLNHAAGKYQPNPEVLSGGSLFFYILTSDGQFHTVGNMGNVYLVIDGDHYEADYNWLASWEADFGTGGAPLPDNYFPQTPVVDWFDYLDDPNARPEDERMEIELPEFPDTTFRWYPGKLEVATETEVVPLVSGSPVWNAYFCDLTGDSLPELCATYSDENGCRCVVLYDYANGASYALCEPEAFDFQLRPGTAGWLYVEKLAHDTGEVIETGRLVFRDGCIQLEQGNVRLRAKLLAVHEGGFLVEPVEGNAEADENTQFLVPIRGMAASPEPKVGDLLEIEYDGSIEESDPARLGGVSHIRVVRRAATKYTLTIGAADVQSIELSTQYTSGGCTHADGSPFQKGEQVWLESLDGSDSLRGLSITARDADGAVVWTANVPDTAENADTTELTDGDWTISAE